MAALVVLKLLRIPIVLAALLNAWSGAVGMRLCLHVVSAPSAEADGNARPARL